MSVPEFMANCRTRRVEIHKIMNTSKSPRAASLITNMLCTALCDVDGVEVKKKTGKPRTEKIVQLRRMNGSAEFPDDPLLPALVAIRAACEA